jgi:hypothetical protein
LLIGEFMLRLGLCCIFRDEPLKFGNTTATAIGKMKRAYQSPSATDALTKPPLPVRGTWLVFASLVLAILTEVLPTEADIFGVR